MVGERLKCVSDLNHPEISNKSMIALLLITRHGARAPIDNWGLPNETGFWKCLGEDSLVPKMEASNGEILRRYMKVVSENSFVFPPSCLNGELLVDGMKQHKELGEYFRKYLVDEIKLLPQVFDPSLIYIRSSSSDRCIRSMISFIQGFYPANNPGEIISFYTGIKSLEPLHPDPYGCRDIQKAYARFLQTEEFSRRKNLSIEKQTPLYNYLQLEKSNENWMWLGDWMYSYVCSNQSIPHVVTEEMFELAMNDTFFYSGGLYKMFPMICSGGIWRTILELINSILSGRSPTKFALLSGHDTTIMAILASLGIDNQTAIPPYRSHLAIEIYKENQIRFVLNGIILKIDDGEYLSFTKLMNMIGQSLKYCID